MPHTYPGHVGMFPPKVSRVPLTYLRQCERLAVGRHLGDRKIVTCCDVQFVIQIFTGEDLHTFRITGRATVECKIDAIVTLFQRMFVD